MRGVDFPARDRQPSDESSRSVSRRPVEIEPPEPGERALSTAIIHLREPLALADQPSVEAKLARGPGVDAVHYAPADAVLAIRFDQDQATLGDIVRAIEDLGSTVSSVAQRRVASRRG